MAIIRDTYPNSAQGTVSPLLSYNLILKKNLCRFVLKMYKKNLQLLLSGKSKEKLINTVYFMMVIWNSEINLNPVFDPLQIGKSLDFQWDDNKRFV